MRGEVRRRERERERQRKRQRKIKRNRERREWRERRENGERSAKRSTANSHLQQNPTILIGLLIVGQPYGIVRLYA